MQQTLLSRLRCTLQQTSASTACANPDIMRLQACQGAYPEALWGRASMLPMGPPSAVSPGGCGSSGYSDEDGPCCGETYGLHSLYQANYIAQ